MTNSAWITVPSSVGTGYYDEHQWGAGNERVSKMKEGILAAAIHYGSQLGGTIAKLHYI